MNLPVICIGRTGIKISPVNTLLFRIICKWNIKPYVDGKPGKIIHKSEEIAY